jgi:hypothetical protein
MEEDYVCELDCQDTGLEKQTVRKPKGYKKKKGLLHPDASLF